MLVQHQKHNVALPIFLKDTTLLQTYDSNLHMSILKNERCVSCPAWRPLLAEDECSFIFSSSYCDVLLILDSRSTHM